MDPIGQQANMAAGHFGAESFYPMSLDVEADKCARIVSTFTQHDDREPGVFDRHAARDSEPGVPTYLDGNVRDKYADRKTQKVLAKIPPQVLREAKGVAIFTVMRCGFVWSGAGGSGVVITKDANGEWGAPSGILIHTLGWGLMVGLDIYDVVLVLRDQRAVDAFRNPKVSVGGELSVSAGPVGNGAMIDSGLEASPCLSYIKSKGFYAGLQLDGTIIISRGDENGRFYHYPDVPIDVLLDNKLPRHQIPHTIIPLWQALCAAEGRPEHLGVDSIPTAPAPGDQEFSENDMKRIEAEMKQQPPSYVGLGTAGDQKQGTAAEDAPPPYEGQGMTGDEKHRPIAEQPSSILPPPQHPSMSGGGAAAAPAQHYPSEPATPVPPVPQHPGEAAPPPVPQHPGEAAPPVPQHPPPTSHAAAPSGIMPPPQRHV